jgi:hypothetical protein
MECTQVQGDLWRERYTAGYAYGRSDARCEREPRDGAMLADIPAELPSETGAAYVLRNLDFAFRVGYTRAYRFEIGRKFDLV